MVDVTSKGITERGARASAFVKMSASTLSKIELTHLPKGDVLGVAKVAGILAAKKVDELIPLAHPLRITDCQISFNFVKKPHPGIEVSSVVKTKGETGVEMEALTSVAIAALTIYDMVKSVERGVTIERIQLEEKWGGKSGHYRREV